MGTDIFNPLHLAAQIQNAGQSPAVKPGARIADDTRAREAAEQFEAQFLSVFAEGMFAGIKTDGPFGGGQGEAVFRSLLLQEYGNSMAKSGGIGLADHVYREILKLQEIDQ